MKHEKTTSMGMPVEKWTHESCSAIIGSGNDWATVYHIQSDKKGQGHATELLIGMQKHYEDQGKQFGSSVALSAPMKHLLIKLSIPEYA